MFMTVLDKALYIRKVLLLHFPPHALVEAAVKPVQTELLHQRRRLRIKPVHPWFQPLGVTVYSARTVAAHPPIHCVRLMRTECPARINRIDLRLRRICADGEERTYGNVSQSCHLITFALLSCNGIQSDFLPLLYHKDGHTRSAPHGTPQVSTTRRP